MIHALVQLFRLSVHLYDKKECHHRIIRLKVPIIHVSSDVDSRVARNQQKRGGDMALEKGDFFPREGRPWLDVHRGACGAIWASAHERGAHLRHLRASLITDAYDLLWGRPCAKEGRLMKAMGRLNRRTVEPHCGARVIRKVMVLR